MKSYLLIAFALASLSQRTYGQFTVIGSQKYSDTQGGFTPSLYDSDRFGEATNIGDLNGDGVIDIAVGAYWRVDPYTETGTLWILMMNANGTIQSTQEIGNNHGGFPNILGHGFNFGSYITPIGDLNNDGVIDLAVSGHDATLAYNYSGAVYIMLMNANGTVNNGYVIDGNNPNFYGVLATEDQFGAGMTGLGDFDGDGVEDIAVGCTQDDDGGFNHGAIYLIMLNTNGTVKSYMKISSLSGNLPFTLDNDDRFSNPVAIGDVNGDGVTDIAACAFWDDDGGTDCGAVYTLMLDNSGNVIDYQKISDAPGPNEVDLNPGDGFGSPLGSAGDLDGNGYIDLIAGAGGDDLAGTDAGACWILLLGPNGTLKSAQKITDGLAGCNIGLDNDDRFGRNGNGIGDFNNDGYKDIAVGADHDDDGGTDRGAFYILYLKYVDTLNAIGLAAADTTLCEKFCTSYFDSSLNNPVSWLWTFEGGVPQTSTDQDPVNICYDNPGAYDVTLITTNAAGVSDTLFLDDYITVFTNPLAPVISQTGNILTSSPADSYQWFLNGNAIPGATNQSYEIAQSGLYTVVIQDENGCSAQSNYKANYTGMENLVSEQDLFIFPNPATDFLTIEWKYGSAITGENFSVGICNILGHEIFSSDEFTFNATIWKKEIDLTGLTQGVYFIEIKSENNGESADKYLARKKFIVSK